MRAFSLGVATGLLIAIAMLIPLAADISALEHRLDRIDRLTE